MNKSEIKRESKRLRRLLIEEKMRHDREYSRLRLELDMVQKVCDHKGQETGHNERDGSWGNPCPTCGYSY